MNNNNKKSRRYTAEERRQHLETWKNSGLIMSEYCRLNDISISSISIWNKEKSEPKPCDLKKVTAKCSSVAPSKPRPIEVVTLDGIKIRLSDVDQLSRILSVIKNASLMEARKCN